MSFTLKEVGIIATTAVADDDASLLNGQTGAYYRDRANHTGTQLAATVSDFSSAAQTAAVIDSIADSDTTHAPSRNAVFDALADKFSKSADDTDDIVVGATNKFATAAEKTKLGFIAVTQAVDLDDIETRVNNLDAAVILKGTWDASAGTFPGGGTAQAGASYIVSVAGTVDGVAFAINDRVIAILDNASTTTFAANWFKADYTDQVLSVNGLTGVVVLGTMSTQDDDAVVIVGGSISDVTFGGSIPIPGLTGTKIQFDTACSDGNFLFNEGAAITGQTEVTPVGADYILFSDTSDSGNLKKGLISALPSGGGGLTEYQVRQRAYKL